jgi:aspartyl-tRNA(Asn)/glutamyl-tRNA(Gln) amidotransferase subunit C
MKIDQTTLRKIAHLARLEFEEEAEEAMLESLSEILTWVEMLNEVDTDNIEPLQSMSQEVNRMREDEIQTSLSRERGLHNAPKKDEQYFRVPKVLEQ